VDAGAGIDRLVIDYSAMTTNVTGGVASGNFGSGYVGHFGDVNVSSIDFEGTEHFTITTGEGNDSLSTGDGADVLRTGRGNDVLKGGGGNDELSGGRGNDRLFSGLGADNLTGGRQADVFIFLSQWRQLARSSNRPNAQVEHCNPHIRAILYKESIHFP
jgi:Ca2+-binding RTX toxin-like protein